MLTLKSSTPHYRADVRGSIEALRDSFGQVDQSRLVSPPFTRSWCHHRTDVVLADASNAIIIGFGVHPDAKARRRRARWRCIRTGASSIRPLRILMRHVSVCKPTEQEMQTGIADVRDTFRYRRLALPPAVMIVGEISATIRSVYWYVMALWYTTGILRRFFPKDDVKSVKSGFECGIGLENFQDIKPGDQLRPIVSSRWLVQNRREENMKQNQYSRRTNEIAREKLANILLFEISDPISSLTVTGCEVSVDKSL